MNAQRTLTAPGSTAPGVLTAPGQLVPGLTSPRALRVPEVAPPFDQEVLPDDVLSTRERPAAARPRGGKPGPASGTRAGTAPTLADVARDDWPQRFARILMETLSGVRPVRQIVPWTTERARSQVRQIGPGLAAGDRPRILRVLTSRPARDVVEMTVIVGTGPRIRALALRLEQSARPGPPSRSRPATRWICTDVEAA